MENSTLISREFLEKALGRKVESFRIKAGSNVGDNFMSVLYAIDVTARIQEDNNKTENLHILSKCYPSHPGQQEFLNKANAFWNELSIYKILIPEFVDLAKKCGFGDKVLFPPLVAGSAVNFKNELDVCESPIAAGKVFGPFDNYIMMTDMRKTHGFRMADRIAGLDIHQMRLAIDAQARLHALSWGYKQINGLSALSDKFDCVNFTMDEEAKEMWVNAMASNVELAANTIREALGKDSVIAESTEKIKDSALLLIEFAYLQSASEMQLYNAHRVKPAETVPEEPWRVLLHGDCWINNLLFRFDEATLKALEMVFVDLQCMRENCPTIDLTYLIYVSTTSEFRKAHLSEILELYHARFSAYCEMMRVTPLPNFTVAELARRFHRSKIYGYYMAVSCLPMMMKEAKDVENLATLAGGEMADVLKYFAQHKAKNDKYSERIVALAQELYAEGVL